MTDTTSTTTETAVDSTDGVAQATSYARGTWQSDLDRAASLFDKSANEKKRATVLLWNGAKTAVTTWMAESADTDSTAEILYGEVKEILGAKRKGDASKIKTVALAVKDHGLDLSGLDHKGKPIENLSKAYAAAIHLTQTVRAQADEDDAADKAIEALDVPNTASTPENAAKIVLSKGVDEAARLLLDALGATNEAAHRALLRALSNEISGRVKPKVTTAQAGPKAGATQAKTGAQAAKPKATATKAKPKAKPVSVSQGDPNKKALPPKATATAQPVKAKAKPVRRPAKASA